MVELAISNKSRIIAIVLIVLNTACYLFQAELVQAISRGSKSVERPYFKPYFLSYFMHSINICFLPLWLLLSYCRNRFDSTSPLWNIPRPVFTWTFIFSLLGVVISVSWYYSLKYAPVSASTAISNSTPVWVFLFSVLLLKERVTFIKVASVIVMVGGVIVVSYFGKEDKTTKDISWIGYVAASSACLFYALYNTLYGRTIKRNLTPAPENSLLVLGLIGVWTFFLHWPGFFVLHYTGLEIFELPPLDSLYGFLINGCLHFVTVSTNFAGIAMTSPLFMAVGLSISMPASILVDYLLHNFFLPWPAFVGISLIFTGFLAFNIGEYIARRRIESDLERVTKRLLPDEGINDQTLEDPLAPLITISKFE